MFDLKRWISGTLMTGLICHGLQATAETGAQFPSIIGQESRITAKFEHTFADLADTYKLGFNELIAANPGMDPWLPTPGADIILPGRHILPPGPRNGILINLSEYRLYYFPEGKPVVTYPIGIGTAEFPTPIIDTKVVAKVDKPTWYPPASIRKRQLEEEGEVMPLAIPPGPDNPLGVFAMRLGIDSYLIHGTNKEMGIGMAVSHGCIRMNNPDVLSLSKIVPVGAAVKIIRQPVKVAVDKGGVWAEVHPDEHVNMRQVIDSMAAQVQKLSMTYPGLHVDPDLVRSVIRSANGRPQQIGQLQASLAAAP
ncbi:MAG: L,D-transpeptidase family protein [Hahellaceae bacterium]|nr:L,D-transpeptidase family protein [Hahellaceae bacterium]